MSCWAHGEQTTDGNGLRENVHIDQIKILHSGLLHTKRPFSAGSLMQLPIRQKKREIFLYGIREVSKNQYH
jgi:hypothetical protein